ncbi:H(+)/Cl(-) exchange transporter ClcA [Fusobacterium sp. DD29]|uniref:ClC family H(+)/Cl(-) exchange transporter n=1 Tax=unclassified Fusobacterium TaxID=2648384 RepID=UPI001B8D2546|nr:MULTISPECIES: ClC family H(+)/Cl(-) exchange transporter [unclassified Fusobacterium]MBR8701561.1 H(+)/Cl(-) exchange transporter ClcA [Fusobacterium sp. DD45]MBR8711284.1 H(+)/Cl(-) exchange transporter ClcA [Fusobacterium sp. DD28]MBR8749197.1 H(+)/Cl(-) exchange transporter ClcA [Fusobacterium sp. DD29]MBR8751847.1 H(+)/Cl(-) exchange transporter ClcA [Fusobacterium sp. DD26]MBR8761465.1 H(+)/Cl(-) exchange transporter ClcA [Fusobacterium sp. DD25]
MKTQENVTDTLKLLHKGSGKLYLLCVAVGAITGFIVSLYRLVLEHTNAFRKMIIEDSVFKGPQFIFIVWIAFILIGFIVDYIAKKYPKISGSGIPQVKGILLRQLDYTKWFQELVAKFVSGVMGIGAGLSLGREGPSVQIGSYVAFGATKLFDRDIVEKKYLITSGASAGLAGAFGAPLSGVMFALEELHRFISAKLLICAFLASIASNFMGRRLFGSATSFDLIALYPNELNPYYQFTLYIILGIIIAFLGKLFTVMLLKAQDIYKTNKVPRWFKVSCVMSSSLLLCYFLPEVTGGGHTLVEEMVTGKNTISILILIFILKLLFTVFSYATGFAGGIFLPMLVLGAVVGKIYAIILIRYLNFPPEFVSHFMVLGMAGYFVAVVRAPITGAVLILEMTGNFDHLLALATVSVIAYYITDILGVEPVYELLYERMAKDTPDEKVHIGKKTLISIPVVGDSELDGKKVSELAIPEDVLLVSIRRNDHDIIPKNSMVIRGGDLLVFLIPKEKAFAMKEELVKEGSN